MNRACERYFQEDICEPDNTTVRQAYYAGFRRAYKGGVEGKAQWIIDKENKIAVCSNCKCGVDKYISYHYNYCPRCGFTMWEDNENE